MSVTVAAPKINQLIAGLPSKERQQVLRSSEHVDLALGVVLCEADALLDYAYFPLTCMISLSAISRDHQPLGMSVIGNGGMLGATLALGVQTAGLRSVVHGSGLALRLTAVRLRRMLRYSPGLATVLRQEAYELIGQFAKTAVCNSFHEVEMRLARWLLMTDDRSNSSQLHLTHQFLADLLGVQRSAVTIAAGKLQDKNLIRYARGQIIILSRSGLEAASCECYVATIAS